MKIDEPTDCVNSITIAEKKNGSLRNCLDPRDLNKAIKRDHYSCPTVEDAAAYLHGAQMFTVIDATSGQWQVKLDKIPVHPTAIRNAFFQKEIDLTYEGFSGVVLIVDDILVYGNNRKYHDAKMYAGTQDLTTRDQI